MRSRWAPGRCTSSATCNARPSAPAGRARRAGCACWRSRHRLKQRRTGGSGRHGARAGRGPGGGGGLGARPGGGGSRGGALPPAAPAPRGQGTRALAARGARGRRGGTGTPGSLAAPAVPGVTGIQITRRYRLEASGAMTHGGRADSSVIATVNGEPWLVRDAATLLLGSRLDTAWTALPAAPGFVPLVDALVNHLARDEASVSEAEGLPRVEFRTRGADTVGATVFGLDPRESDLTPAPLALARAVR